MDEPVRRFGQNLRRLREARGLTQDEVADRAGTDAASIRRYERGVRDPSIKALVRLAQALDAKAADLLDEID